MSKWRATNAAAKFKYIKLGAHFNKEVPTGAEQLNLLRKQQHLQASNFTILYLGYYITVRKLAVKLTINQISNILNFT